MSAIRDRGLHLPLAWPDGARQAAGGRPVRLTAAADLAARPGAEQRAPPQARRSPGFTLLRGLPGSLPPGWHIGLAADRRVVLEAERRAKLSIAVTALVSEITGFRLALAPYRGVLDEAGVAAPVVSAGTVNT